MTRTSFLDTVKQTRSSALTQPIIQRSPVVAPVVIKMFVEKDIHSQIEWLEFITENWEG